MKIPNCVVFDSQSVVSLARIVSEDSQLAVGGDVDGLSLARIVSEDSQPIPVCL